MIFFKKNKRAEELEGVVNHKNEVIRNLQDRLKTLEIVNSDLKDVNETTKKVLDRYTGLVKEYERKLGIK